jgi:hypothetical protein
MEQWLAPRDIDVMAAKLHQISRYAAEPLSRELSNRRFAALVFAVEAPQVASAGDLPDARVWLARHAIERVPVQMKRTPA